MKKGRISQAFLAASVLSLCLWSVPGLAETPPPTTVNSETSFPPETLNVDFPSPGYNLQQTREVPLPLLNPKTAPSLQLSVQQPLANLLSSQNGQSSQSSVGVGAEDFAIEVQGTLYVTSGTDDVFALDAATGALRWHWSPPSTYVTTSAFPVPVNRGVAYGDGRIYLLTMGDWLVSLDANTGQQLKAVPLWQTVPGATPANGYFEATAPIYWNGLVFVGSSGGDNGAHGFIMAYHADSLEPAWKQPFFTVPPDASYGGGTVWTPVTIDPVSGLLFASTGNPSPDFYGANRPGANLYTDCVIALNPFTGRLVWYNQENVHDLLDYDAAAPPMVLTANIAGRLERIVVEGGKDGKWFAWDARTGAPVPYNPDNQGIPFVEINNQPPTPSGTLEYPGTLGGENYAPEAFDSQDGLALIPGINAPNYVCSSTNGTTETTSVCQQSVGEQGGTAISYPYGTPSGNITAINVNTGQIAYQFRTPTPMRGGITTTTGGVGFFGGLDSTLTVFDTKTGKILASLPTSGPIAAPPIVYAINGRPYVAIVAGGTFTSQPGPVPPVVDIYTIGESE